MSRPANVRREGRPRDSHATKELLLAAATEEFAEYGFAGARIDRIAERAGANKRLLYVYFGDKDQVFDAVLQRQIGALVEAMPLDPRDLAGFAAARFDYMLANRQVARLVAWRTVERTEPIEIELRSYQAKLEAIAGAQRDGEVYAAVPAVDLFAMVLRITESWLNAPQALRALADDEPDSPDRLREHRAALVDAVRAIADPRRAGPGAGRS
ncbi:TetR family transcriptional regulator [Micromonospora sp. WMMD812]|uniref:TetR family transcriptional regulator n=1 Tax=Micromonospora sp. WMMD812 TaxID=3015152 RepID=UPI00248CF94F|nr:TetR family transcriptional regulator [Micromonospora sp. WMMD812]WBB65200.1 TetR family transcriptional regulator [Micromonospora sp. WMMD812]